MTASSSWPKPATWPAAGGAGGAYGPGAAALPAPDPAPEQTAAEEVHLHRLGLYLGRDYAVTTLHGSGTMGHLVDVVMTGHVPAALLLERGGHEVLIPWHAVASLTPQRNHPVTG